jgi:valyl-tRNA synthetase
MSQGKQAPRISSPRWTQELEKSVVDEWHAKRIFRFDLSRTEEVYSIDTPPPYLTDKWHVCQAGHYAQIDMVARYKKLKGYNVLFPFGADRNGLPIEVMVERKKGVRAKDVPRAEFLGLCKDYLDSVEGGIVGQVKAMGMGMDLEDYYRTDSPEYRAVTQASFIDMWNKGLVYEDLRPTSWCPRCGTPIADAEIEYQDKPSSLTYIRFRVKETGKDVTVATTRPELLPACAVLIFNPDDERYAALEGLTAVVPMFGQEVKIVSHPVAKMEFGTGIVMMCSYGDLTDVRLFREMGLTARTTIDSEGKLTEAAGEFAGLPVAEGRKRVVERLKKEGLVSKEEGISHRTPTCWRCHESIEIVDTKEFYVKQLSLRDDIRKTADSMEFHPPWSKQVLYDWVDSIMQDWPISRRRYYATEIPIWYCKDCSTPFLPPKGRYYQPWREDPPPGSKCTKCGSNRFTGETRVLDTWMDSSVSQLYIIGYGRNEKMFNRLRPASMRPQGIDIVRTWLYYSVLRSLLLLGDRAFKQVRISGMGLDEKGEAMHKSRGNVVYPEPMIDRYGVDAFRLWSASEGKLGYNYRFSEERVRGASLFITKLWNICRFASQFPTEPKSSISHPLDVLFLLASQDAVANAEREYEDLDPFGAASVMRDFVWNYLADHYLEMVKPRLYSERNGPGERSARAALHEILRLVLITLHPIIPVITDYVYGQLYDQKILEQKFPSGIPAISEEDKQVLSLLLKANSAIWRKKKELGLSLNSPIDGPVHLNPKLAPFSEDLKAAHKIASIDLGEEQSEDGEPVGAHFS